MASKPTLQNMVFLLLKMVCFKSFPLMVVCCFMEWIYHLHDKTFTPKCEHITPMDTGERNKINVENVRFYMCVICT